MQRIRFFDIAKGIAILAVILGHSAIEANVFIPHHTAQLVVAVLLLPHAVVLHTVRLFHASET